MITLGTGGKREGMAERSNHPMDKVRSERQAVHPVVSLRAGSSG